MHSSVSSLSFYGAHGSHIMGKTVKMCKIVMLSYTNVRQMRRPDQERLSKLDASTYAHCNLSSVQPRISQEITQSIAVPIFPMRIESWQALYRPEPSLSVGVLLLQQNMPSAPQ